MQRQVIVSTPSKIGAKIAELNIEAENPYQAVEVVRGLWKKHLLDGESKFGKLKFSQIIPIHNLSGLRDSTQVTTMIKNIEQGQEVVESDGLPNVKLIGVENEKFLLFDGTHSLLAYALAEKKELREIPYLLIKSQTDPITAEEISTFFPKEARESVLEQPLNYVVNWQAEKGKQLEVREVETFGDLLDQFSKRYKPTGQK